MLEIKDIENELRIRYTQRAFPANINVCPCGWNHDEIMVMFDIKQYSIVERFKEDTSLDNIFEVMDELIHNKEYEYAYLELKKYWGDKVIEYVELKKLYPNVPEIKISDNEILVLDNNNNVFTVEFFDETRSYKINQLYNVRQDENQNYYFNKIDSKLINDNQEEQFEKDIIRVEENREELKRRVDKSRAELETSIFNKILEFESYLDKGMSEINKA